MYHVTCGDDLLGYKDKVIVGEVILVVVDRVPRGPVRGHRPSRSPHPRGFRVPAIVKPPPTLAPSGTGRGAKVVIVSVLGREHHPIGCYAATNVVEGVWGGRGRQVWSQCQHVVTHFRSNFESVIDSGE